MLGDSIGDNMNMIWGKWKIVDCSNQTLKLIAIFNTIMFMPRILKDQFVITYYKFYNGMLDNKIEGLRKEIEKLT